MKLHLGSGKRRILGWINVDIDPANEPDVVADCFTGATSLRYDCDWMHSESADVVYACHVLEHVGRHQYKKALEFWHDLLKPGGILRLSVPDLEAVFAYYIADLERLGTGSKLNELLGFLYGGQRNEHDCHKMGWDEATLTRDLLEAGFKDVRRYDRDKTEHAGVDDYSASYLPKLSQCKSMGEYRKGTLLSLNIEATKG